METHSTGKNLKELLSLLFEKQREILPFELSLSFLKKRYLFIYLKESERERA